MNQEVLASDRDRGFTDWGTTVVLRRVAQAFAPETGELTETYDDRAVLAITAAAGQGAVTETAGHAGRFAQMFLVRSEDIDAEMELRSLRVVCGDQQYRVQDVESWSQARMFLLKCTRV